MRQIDQPYFDWLISQIEFPRNFKGTYGELLVRLHETEFIWTISGDDNRVQDVQDLRREYRENFGSVRFKNYVSVLEVMIAVSRILEFVAGGQANAWAWRLIDNLRLNHYYDPLTPSKRAKIDNILENLIWRTYKPNGTGGFFPLIFPREDQTKVEIWYQLNAYVNEIVKEF